MFDFEQEIEGLVLTFVTQLFTLILGAIEALFAEFFASFPFFFAM